jgi:hypothetical protein
MQLAALHCNATVGVEIIEEELDQDESAGGWHVVIEFASASDERSPHRMGRETEDPARRVLRVTFREHLGEFSICGTFA